MDKKTNQTPTIGIIGGKGRMGRLFSEFFQERGLEVLISDVGTKLTNKEVAEKADITIVSVPIDYTEKVIKEILPHVNSGAALMDFTSIKTIAVNAMLKGKCEVLGLHPMFGNSNPIPGQTVIICPTKKSGKWSLWLENFLKNQNVKIEKMSAQEHDKIMNVVQGLIHFAEITFADGLRRTGMTIDELLRFTGKASELKVQLAARIIDQDPGLYGNIQIQNPYALNSLKAFQKSVEELLKIVRKKDLKNFKKYFEKNRKFLGKYTKEAYHDSTYLIDKFQELQKNKKQETKAQKPAQDNLAVLGPKNTFSDMAATEYLEKNGLKLKKYFAKDIEEIFELVEQGKVDHGLVPIENKLNGSVRESLDALFRKKVHITNEMNLAIHHCLMVLAVSKKSEIKTIVSHSQALSQCRKYLRKNFPNANLEESPSTAAALEKLIATNNKTLAVIAPKQAAVDKNNLKILAENIEDENDNSTTFVAINREEMTLDNSGKISEKTSANKTSIAFHFSADAPGSLFSVFKEFADAKINMTKIESRPTKKQFGDYIFYLDFDGSITDPHIQKTLKSVEQKVARLKILGSY